jgi:hypothetical protein
MLPPDQIIFYLTTCMLQAAYKNPEPGEIPIDDFFYEF